MNGGVAYLDTSAFLKLVVVEPESAALHRFLTRWPGRASASLLRAEAIRALRRAGQGAHLGAARQLLGAIRLIRLDEPLLDRAAELDPPTCAPSTRSTWPAALAIGPDLGAFLTYDERLAGAARWHGLAVQAPS